MKVAALNDFATLNVNLNPVLLLNKLECLLQTTLSKPDIRII